MSEVNVVELQECMNKLLSLNKVLLELSEKKKDCLIKNDVAGLELLIAEEQERLSDLTRQEHRRQKAVLEIMRNSGQTAEAWTLEDVLPFLSESYRKQISSLKEDLLIVIQLLRDNNKTIDDLTQLSLNYVEYMINTLAGDGEDIGVYSTQPEEAGRQGVSRLIDWKA